MNKGGRQRGFHNASLKMSRKAHDVSGALAQALSFHQNGFLADAQTLYREILQKRPNHFDALHLLGASECQTGHLDAAEHFIRRALVIDPRSAAAHSNLGNVLTRLSRLDEALASFDKAIARKPDYAEAFFNKGNVLNELKRFADAVASYDRAIELKQDHAEAAFNRSNALLQLRRPTEALESCDQALALEPNFAEAWNNRGNILQDLKRFDDALASYDKAVALKPDFASAHHNRGITLLQLRRSEAALESFDRAMSLNPSCDGALFFFRGNALLDLKRWIEALSSYDRAIDLDPDDATAFNNRGKALHKLKRFAEAVASYDRAIMLKPDYVSALSNRGAVLLALKRFDEALASCDVAIVLDPEYVEAFNNRGNALQGLKRHDDALASYDRAIAMKPDFAGAFNNRGGALKELMRMDEAVASFDQALAVEPDDADAWGNRGDALAGLERFEEARASYERALAIDPDLVVAWLGRASIPKTDLAEALAACNHALAIDPKSVRALSQLGQCHANQGDSAQAVAYYDRALAIMPDHADAISSRIFALDFAENAGFEQHQAARASWWHHVGSKIMARSPLHHDNDRDPTRRIVLGYVSSDFRLHSAALGFRPVLKNRDKMRFEVICYACSPTEDPVTRDFQQMADKWRNASRWSDDRLADQIRADKVDILIDLSGHSAGHRLRTFARKPAPIQVTAWGHATGTGLPTIDYLFSDPIAIPAGARHLFAERIYDLPCLVVIEPPEVELRSSEPPVLSRGHMTYGVFNRVSKISDAAVGVWARILQSDLDARLLIKDGSVDDQSIRLMLTERFAGHGVSTDRIDLLGSTSRGEHLAAYGQVDICLDPFPQTGGVSTWEALHMGVPVVAKLGSGVSSRLSGAILSSIGMAEWVAAEDDKYSEIALKYATMPDRLRTIRHGLPARIATSAGNPAAYAKAVEDAYRAMWEDFCQRAT